MPCHSHGFETEWWYKKTTKNGTIFENFESWKWEKDTISKRRAMKTQWRGAMLSNNGDFIYCFWMWSFLFFFFTKCPPVITNSILKSFLLIGHEEFVIIPLGSARTECSLFRQNPVFVSSKPLSMLLKVKHSRLTLTLKWLTRTITVNLQRY